MCTHVSDTALGFDRAIKHIFVPSIYQRKEGFTLEVTTGTRPNSRLILPFGHLLQIVELLIYLCQMSTWLD
jgi:hypothetical protein